MRWGHRLCSCKRTESQSHRVLEPAAQLLVSPGPAQSWRVLPIPVTHTDGLLPWPAGSGCQPQLPSVHDPRVGDGKYRLCSKHNT